MSLVAGAGSKTSTVEAMEFDAGSLRQAMLDLLIENDEALFADFVLDPVRVTGKRLHDALVAQVAANQVFPAFAGSAGTGRGLPD